MSTDRASAFGRRVQEILWHRSIDRADSRQHVGNRFRAKRPRGEALGSERPGEARGVIQGQVRTKWPEPLGFAEIADVVPERRLARRTVTATDGTKAKIQSLYVPLDAPLPVPQSAYGLWREAVYAEGLHIDSPARAPKGSTVSDAPRADTVSAVFAAMQRATLAKEARRIKAARLAFDGR